MGCDSPFPNRVVKIKGGSSPSMISKWGVTPPPSLSQAQKVYSLILNNNNNNNKKKKK